MNNVAFISDPPHGGKIADGFEKSKRRLLDYARVGRQLFIQRVVIYSTAITLAGAYYSWGMASVFYALLVICEAYDAWVFYRIIQRRTWTEADIVAAMRGVYAGTILSATTIAVCAVLFALQQPHTTGHFMPMFMLVSAAIFAAMNNNQFLRVLGIRLSIYVAAIIFIPLNDVWQTRAPLSSEVWLHLFTVLYILAFLFELARHFLANYSNSLQILMDLEGKHEQTLAAFKAKTDFLSTVSHELRTPITSIKGPLEMINAGALGEVPEKMSVALEIAARNTRRLQSLVEDLLLLQSADAGKLNFHFETVDIGKLVQEVSERFTPYAEAKEVVVQVQVQPNMYWVQCDQKRMDQVVTNLLSNAAKFSNPGGRVSVSVQALDDIVQISVIDEGVGIPDGTGDKIFEEFKQLDSSSSRNFQGTGLGLSISRRIIEAHGGHIGYVSTLGHGSTFYVHLQKVRV
ncbi:MAG: HAMP domain-containing sensor histidine kinase [Paracoccaceae bacterium]|nr:HAMP domain-containing sensor histidine kinase [Paracoccaceae bacterium]